MKRNQAFIQIIAFLLLVACGIYVYFMVQDTSGLSINSTPVKDRVSSQYISKTVNQTQPQSHVMKMTGREEGSANIVTSIVVNYRMFDTLGEVLVLFAATAGVGLLLASRKKEKKTTASPITDFAIPLISLLVITTGLVIILYGHLSPGGGFPGGALIASGLILLSIIGKKIKPGIFMLFESLAGIGILAVGITGLFVKGTFFADFLPAGTIGNILSAGMVPVLYTLIGIKVASEIANIGSIFLQEEESN